MPPYGQPMPGSYANPGMPPYGQPGPGGYANQEMPYGQPMAGPGRYGSPGMPPYGQAMPPEQEIAFLKDQAHMLKDQLDQIDARIQELEKEAT